MDRSACNDCTHPLCQELVRNDAALGDDDQKAAQQEDEAGKEAKGKGRDAHHVPDITVTW